MTSPSPSTSMRVGVNLMWCLPGQVGGSEQYLTRQLAGALDAQPDLDLTVFATPEYLDRHRQTLVGAELVAAPVDGHARWKRVAAESTWLYARTGGFDVVQHGGGTAPRAGYRRVRAGRWPRIADARRRARPPSPATPRPRR